VPNGGALLKRRGGVSDQVVMTAHVKAILLQVLLSTLMLCLILLVALPFMAVLSGGEVATTPFQVLGSVVALCFYGLTGLAGVGFRGARPRPSWFASTVVALSAVGLLTALVAIWSGLGPTPESAHARWAVAGIMLMLTLGGVALGTIVSRFER
jgi:peptidoglycan/LPS O-acetylase OafA/YrhL